MAIELTKELLADLRKARSLVFRFEQDTDHSTLDVFTGEIGSDNDRRVTYPLKTGIHFNYTGTWHTFSYPNQRTPLTTFIESLRAGDLLDFEVTDYANQYVRESGFIHDQLSCIVRRHKRDGRTLQFCREYFVDSQVVPERQRNMHKRAG